MAGSCNSIRCKVSFEKEALSIRHYILPVDDPNNDADFYDRLVAKIDQDIVKAKSEAITQPCFTLYWTDQDGDAICVDSEESFQTALSYVKPDAAGFSVLRLIAKFSPNGSVKISNGIAIYGPSKLTPITDKRSASASPPKKPNGSVKKVKKVYVQSFETSLQKPVSRAGPSKAAVRVMEGAMDDGMDEAQDEGSSQVSKPVLCPGCDESFFNYAVFKRNHWAECSEIEDRDRVSGRCPNCREVFAGKQWTSHQRGCKLKKESAPAKATSRKMPKSAVPLLCPGCNEKCRSFAEFKKRHWPQCSEIEQTDELTVRCCHCKETFNGHGWNKHQRFCKHRGASPKKKNGVTQNGTERKSLKVLFRKKRKEFKGASRVGYPSQQKVECDPGCGKVLGSAANLKRHRLTCKLVPTDTGEDFEAASARSESSSGNMPLNTTWRSWARSNHSPEIPLSVSHSSAGKRSVSPASTEEVDGNFGHREGTASPTTEVGQDTEVNWTERYPSQVDDEPEDVKPDLATLNAHYAASQHVADTR
ncbi:hypothetical protein RvY_07191 [Ramazzottius varieornatus]|uniref:PB1 domain-containing protein n=1 Tax=Ramazzottius varieornatus TaxID=947166 RepID=A0A1D1V4F8_RAMVA|nr:hypothetical protein RvY_07191 [Ramazzottius varieornatus]